MRFRRAIYRPGITMIPTEPQSECRLLLFFCSPRESVRVISSVPPTKLCMPPESRGMPHEFFRASKYECGRTVTHEELWKRGGIAAIETALVGDGCQHLNC